MIKFYSKSDSDEVNTHNSIQCAKQAAESDLDICREDAADNGWPCSTDLISYGVMIPLYSAEETKHRTKPVDADEKQLWEDMGISEVFDFVIVPTKYNSNLVFELLRMITDRDEIIRLRDETIASNQATIERLRVRGYPSECHGDLHDRD